jgi:hypothetical protein
MMVRSSIKFNIKVPNTAMTAQEYQAFAQNSDFKSQQNKIETTADMGRIKKVFGDNNLNFVGSRTNNEGVGKF